MCYALCMKKSLKNLRVWLFTGIFVLVGAGVPFLILAITLNLENTAAFQYPLLLGAFAAVYLLVGFVWGDLHIVAYRRKNKNWDGELPQDIKDSAWVRRMPFYAAAAIVFTVFMVFEVIFWITGNYPFL